MPGLSIPPLKEGLPPPLKDSFCNAGRAVSCYDSFMTSSFLWILLSLAIYGFLHSLFASHTLKRWACRVGGDVARRSYRLVYNIFVALTFVPVVALVAFLPDAPLYAFPGVWRWLGYGLQGLGAVALVVVLLQTDLGSFSGLSQLRGRDESLCSPDARGRSGTLVTSGFYRWVRHPLYTAGLVFLWANPQVSWNTLALNIGATAYLIIGAILEERKLVTEFGAAYAEYRRRTPMLIPFRLP